ncbi:MAG: hypothetical protein ACOC80_00735 [Petrotogales bacterium]
MSIQETQVWSGGTSNIFIGDHMDKTETIDALCEQKGLSVDFNRALIRTQIYPHRFENLYHCMYSKGDHCEYMRQYGQHKICTYSDKE